MVQKVIEEISTCVNPGILISKVWASNPLQPIYDQRETFTWPSPGVHLAFTWRSPGINLAFTAYGNVCLLQEVGSNSTFFEQDIKTLKECSNNA